MSTDTEVVKTIEVTPIFNYTRDVEIAKRFIERVTEMARDVNTGDLYKYMDANLDHVRSAVSGIMADDVKRQILEGIFPIRGPVFEPHQFSRDTSAYADGVLIKADVCLVKVRGRGTCGLYEGAPEHTL